MTRNVRSMSKRRSAAAPITSSSAGPYARRRTPKRPHKRSNGASPRFLGRRCSNGSVPAYQQWVELRCAVPHSLGYSPARIVRRKAHSPHNLHLTLRGGTPISALGQASPTRRLILEGMIDDRNPSGRAPSTAFFFVWTLRQAPGLDVGSTKRRAGGTLPPL